MTSDKRQEFLASAYSILKANPDWIPEVLRMLALSSEDAARTYSIRTAEAQSACVCALALANGKRVDAKLKDILCGKIEGYLRTIKNKCGVEIEALEKLREVHSEEGAAGGGTGE